MIGRFGFNYFLKILRGQFRAEFVNWIVDLENYVAEILVEFFDRDF